MIVFQFCLQAKNIAARDIYELRKLTESDWLKMSSEERLTALGIGNKLSQNQTFIGDFGKHYDMYKKWGYDFYEMEDRYENYAFRGFQQYNIIEERRRRWSYDEFGDRITKITYDGVIWNEKYFGDGTFYVQPPKNYLNAMAVVAVDGVWVARESTDDWAFSAIGAGALRSKYTPLTLSLPNIDGMRLDFQSANSTLSILNSSVLGSYDNYRTSGILEESDLYRKGGVLLRGGHFQRKFGILTVGATYVNQYSVQGNRRGGDVWEGTVSNLVSTPLIVALRFLDDSPEDNVGGPIIYNVSLIIDGRERLDIKPQIISDNTLFDRTSAIDNVAYKNYMDPQSESFHRPPKVDFLKYEGRIPKYGDYLFLNDWLKGNNIKNIGRYKFDVNRAQSYYSLLEPNADPIRANGTQAVVYLFDITSIKTKVTRIQADVTVANDYNIQTSMIYTKEQAGGHDLAGENTTWYNASYWRTAAQADGNIKDGSNIQRLQVDFGFQTASIIYGLNADIDYRGLTIMGEYVTNASHYMFPDGEPGTGQPRYFISGSPPRAGHRWAQKDNAYYLIIQKDWRKIGLTGELFKMGKFYRPYLDYHFPHAKDRLYGLNTFNSRNSTLRLPFIEDNDDDDQYPDTMPVTRGMGYQLFAHEDPDGVFPGNDADNDGIADNNKNFNTIPDYDEPFLMFDSDPDEFVFGDDFNNNTIPDYREDDLKMDTPYDLDRQGHHFYLRYTPVTHIDLMLGSIKTNGIGLDTRTYDDYFKAKLEYNVFNVGKCFAEYRYERIQDNIRDPFFQVRVTQKDDWFMKGSGATAERFARDFIYDELDYKNSKINRLFLDFRIRAIPSITLENHMKLEKNHQIKGTMYDRTYQQDDKLRILAMVNKAAYTKSFGNMLFSSGVKFRYYKKARSSSIRPRDHYSMRVPLFMFKYIISPRTDVTLGLQGIPGFVLRYKDYVQNENNFKQTTYLLQLQNSTNYFGYQIWTSVGFMIDQLDYEFIFRKFENYKSSSTFVKVYLGW